MQTDRPVEPTTVEVVSEMLLFPSRNGLKIAACWDHRSAGYERYPFVVLAPKFGESKKNNLQLGYYLAANGLNVIRFDHTNHIGESAGERLHFTLPGAVEDIAGTFDYLEQHFEASSAGLIGASLSARSALRAAATDRRVAFLLSVVGVVDFRSTLRRVYREDLFEAFFDGRALGVNNILGYEIDFDAFGRAAVEANLHDLEGTIADARELRVPARFYVAANDLWVDPADVMQVASATPHARVHSIPDAMHEVRENPEAAERLFREIVATCVGFSYGANVSRDALAAPRKACLLRQNRAERERLRRTEEIAEDAGAFWSDYLKKFDYLKNGRAYRNYLDVVADLLGPFEPGAVFLDAGSGNGTLGVWAQRAFTRRSETSDATLGVTWLSIDLTPAGLTEAMRQHAAHSHDVSLAASTASGGVALDFAYLRTDFDQAHYPQGAPDPLGWLAAGSVDGVAASLLLSYVQDPPGLLRAFHRVLRAGGRIVVTSMKPHCDMTGIWRDFVDEGARGEMLEPARDLLRAAGTLRLREEVGHYRFYSAEEIVAMLTRAGFRRCTPFLAFSSQAVVVRAEK